MNRWKTIRKNAEKQTNAGYIHHPARACCGNCVFKVQNKVIVTVAKRAFLKKDSPRCYAHDMMAISVFGICPSHTALKEYEGLLYDFELHREGHRTIKTLENGNEVDKEVSGP